MMIDNDDLKCNDQFSKLMHALAILTKFFKHSVFSTTTLRYFYKTLSRPRVNELLHLLVTLVNSSFEKGGFVNDSFDESLSKILVLIW